MTSVYKYIFSSRIQGEDALSKLTKFGHAYFERCYLETDRMLFSLMVALEVSVRTCRLVYGACANLYTCVYTLIIYTIIHRLKPVLAGLTWRRG